MASSFDPGSDFARIADGLEAVTLVRQGSPQTIALAHALRRAVSQRDRGKSAGQYTSADAVWHLEAAELAEPPRPGDVLLDGQGRRWTVLRVQRQTFGGRWRCFARDLAVAAGLDNTIDIEKATFTPGAGGAQEPLWEPWRTGVAARIQPLESRVTQDADRTTTQTRFKVFIAENLDVDHTCRIKGPGGAIYRVVGARGLGRIDRLMEIDVVGEG